MQVGITGSLLDVGLVFSALGFSLTQIVPGRFGWPIKNTSTKLF